MKIEIKNRWNGSIIFSHECADNTIKLTLLKAIEEGSNLSGSDLSDSNLRGSNLSGGNLRGSDLRGSNLRGSNLTPIRDDIWSILSSAPKEVPGLISAIKSGKIDGSTYVGSCACLVGTIANLRNVDKCAMDGLSPNASRPAERFFMGISEGDTPETNQFSKLALEWCEDWLNRMKSAFGENIL